MLDGEEENYDQWDFQWQTFAQVENLVSTLGKQLDTDMHDSVLSFNKTENAGKTSKWQKPTNGLPSIGIEAHEVVAFLTRAMITEWPEGEAWKVMKQVQDIY